MNRALAAAACLFLAVSASCAATDAVRDSLWKGSVLTYDQYLSVDQAAKPPYTVDAVIRKLGAPKETRKEKGVVRELDYHSASLMEDMKIATFYFDADGKLVDKRMW